VFRLPGCAWRGLSRAWRVGRCSVQGRHDAPPLRILGSRIAATPLRLR
jgi:hypothetical protein